MRSGTGWVSGSAAASASVSGSGADSWSEAVDISRGVETVLELPLRPLDIPIPLLVRMMMGAFFSLVGVGAGGGAYELTGRPRGTRLRTCFLPARRVVVGMRAGAGRIPQLEVRGRFEADG